MRDKLYAVKRDDNHGENSTISSIRYIRYNICGFFTKKENAQKYANKLNNNSITTYYYLIIVHTNKKTILKSKKISVIDKIKFMVTGSLKGLNEI